MTGAFGFSTQQLATSFLAELRDVGPFNGVDQHHRAHFLDDQSMTLSARCDLDRITFIIENDGRFNNDGTLLRDYVQEAQEQLGCSRSPDN